MLALESGTFGAAYYVKSDGHVKFSLRSRTKFNVRLIAEMFGGGGHDKAAGFTVDKTEFHTSGVMSIESHAGEKE